MIRFLWSTIFEFFNPFVNTPLWQDTVPVLCRKSPKHLPITKIVSLLVVPLWCKFLIEQLWFICNNSKTNERIRIKFSWHNHNNKINEDRGQYGHCKKVYVKIVDNFLLTLVYTKYIEIYRIDNRIFLIFSMYFFIIYIFILLFLFDILFFYDNRMLDEYK